MISIEKYPIMEHFFTIQGEGTYSGRAAYFIRIAGCDVGCVWCDVKESWDKDQHTTMTIKEIIENVTESKTDFVVITGGEPAMYDLRPLVDQLKSLGITIAIETSGCYPLQGDVEVIISHPSDLEWANKHAEKVLDSCHLFLQPEWSKTEKLLPLIISYVKGNLKWKISLQTHKYMNIP